MYLGHFLPIPLFENVFSCIYRSVITLLAFNLSVELKIV
ncbi:MAG: hypothetical protein OFPI_40420 [Osedax symbiont Rs2]|nr:MAG: hypothetical protein OFPI_40420 [Osedax symbiont Rs2]